MKSISSIVSADLCCGCGTCVSFCSQSAISMVIDKNKWVASIDSKRCIDCGHCNSVCPSFGLQLQHLNEPLLDGELNAYIGNYRNCYYGFSEDQQIRFQASSGGIVTELLITALEKGLIDGAFVVRAANDPLKPVPFFADTKTALISDLTSKYCPIPANLCIKDIINRNGRFAIVGLPCHIQAFRKAESVYPQLKDKVVLKIGLFCGHTPNFAATDLLLSKLGIRKDSVKQFAYRGHGWPGGVTILLKNGKTYSIPHSDFLAWGGIFGSPFFTPLRCSLCSDGANEFADISVGDAWLKELSSDKTGTSVFITRTEVGQQLVDMSKRSQYISLRRINPMKVIQSQKYMLHYKKKNIQARYFAARVLGRQTPPKVTNVLNPRSISYLTSIITIAAVIFSSNDKITRHLVFLPKPIFHIINRLFSLIDLVL